MVSLSFAKGVMQSLVSDGSMFIHLVSHVALNRMTLGGISWEGQTIERPCQQGQRLSMITVQDPSTAQVPCGQFSPFLYPMLPDPGEHVASRSRDHLINVSECSEGSPSPQSLPNHVPRGSQNSSHPGSQAKSW